MMEEKGKESRSVSSDVEYKLLNPIENNVSEILFKRAMEKCITNNSCTFMVTKRGYFHQRFFRCKQCGFEEGSKGFCLSCRNTCHKYHEGVIEFENSPTTCFCDCQAETGKCSCLENDNFVPEIVYDPNELPVVVGNFTGLGEYLFKFSGCVYKGAWKNGKMHGKGKMSFNYGLNNSEWYEGDFFENKMEGKGTLKYLNGIWRKYVGDFENNEIHGKGRLESFKDAHYIGEFLNGKRDESKPATLHYHMGPRMGREYRGMFKNQRFHGQGILKIENGGSYYGEFKNGKFCGSGRIIQEDGTVSYEGSWKDGLYDGKGMKKSKGEDGDEEIYNGSFKNDVREGYGVLMTSNRTVKYRGNWENDQFEGQGTRIFKDGRKYEGYWKGGKQHGKGIFYNKNGDRYDGYWRRGRIDGRGISTYKNKCTRMSYFQGDKRHGVSILFDSRGEKISTKFYFEGKEIKKKNVSEYFGEKYFTISYLREIDGLAFHSVYELLREDVDVLLAAIGNNPSILKHGEKVIWDIENDKEIVMKIVTKNGLGLGYVGEKFRKNMDVVQVSLQQNGMAIEFVHPSLITSSIDLLYLSVQQNGKALGFISRNYFGKLMKDVEQKIINFAVGQDGLALEFIDYETQVKNPDIVRKAVQQNGLSLKFCKIRPKKENEEILRRIYEDALTQNYYALSYIDFSIIMDKRIIENSLTRALEEMKHHIFVTKSQKLHKKIKKDIEEFFEWILLSHVCRFDWLEGQGGDSSFNDISLRNSTSRKTTRIEKTFQDCVSNFGIAENELKKLRDNVWNFLVSSSNFQEFFEGEEYFQIIRQLGSKFFKLYRMPNKKDLFLGFFDINGKYSSPSYSFHQSNEEEESEGEEDVEENSNKSKKMKKQLQQRHGYGILFKQIKGIFPGSKKRYNRVFHGFFYCSEKHGRGCEYSSKTGHLVFEGRYSHDIKNGSGMEYTLLGKSTNIPTFEGIFKNGLKDGPGELHVSGMVKKGIWRAGELDGKTLRTFSCPIIEYSAIEKLLKDSHIIGQGASGRVYRVKTSLIPSSIELSCKKYGEYVAIKVMVSRLKIESIILSRIIKRGIELSSRLDNPHVIKTFAMFQGKGKSGYIQTLCKMSIDEVILSSNGTLSITEKLKMLYQTSKGILALHNENIMHRDLKWGNVLMSYQDEIKLTDFDTLREDERNWRLLSQNLSSKVGTPGFMAPEVFLGKNYSLKCDVYSFGIMIYSLLFELTQPFTSQYQCPACGTNAVNILSSSSLQNHIASCNFRPLVDPKRCSEFPKFLIDLMIQCWDRNPFNRPSFKQIFEIFENEKKKEKCYTIIRISFEKYHFQFSRPEVSKNKKKKKKKKSSSRRQRMLLLRPRYESIVEWIEKKYVGSKVLILTHHILGDVINDEDVLKMIKNEEQPLLEIKLDLTNFETNDVIVSPFSNTSSSSSSPFFGHLFKRKEKKENIKEELELEMEELKKRIEELEEENRKWKEKYELLVLEKRIEKQNNNM